MSNPSEAFTNNKFIDKMLKIIPEDPVSQVSYMYFLTIIVFVGLMGFSISSWYQTVTNFELTIMFRSVFMTAISLLSLFGLKQTRNTYLVTKNLYKDLKKGNQPELKEDTLDEMISDFKKEVTK